jgi:hypothetical protein
MNLRKSHLDKAVFIIVVLDLMFLPYIRSLSASLSMLILPLWFIFRTSLLIKDPDFKICIFAFSIVVFSFLAAFATYPDGFMLRNGDYGYAISMAPNTVIISYMLMYFIFFKTIAIKYQINIQSYLIAYIFFISILAAIFYYDPSLYFKVRSFWTMYDNIIEVSIFESSSFRFTGTLSEPNNLAAIICAIMAYILFFCEQRYLTKVTVIMLSSFTVVATMSSSGIFILSIILLLFFVLGFITQSNNRKKFILNMASILSILALAIFAFSYLQETLVGKVSAERIASNSMGSRFQIWFNSFDIEKILMSLFWGDGGLVIFDGRVINPHNGHLHLIYSYGLIFYSIFMYLFFSPWIKRFFSIRAAFFIPIAVCFTINVGIYELRFAGLTALLIACYKVFENRELKPALTMRASATSNKPNYRHKSLQKPRLTH